MGGLLAAWPGSVTLSPLNSQVAAGGWLHVFPEGRLMMTGVLGPFRWGVGKVVCDAKKAADGR